MLTEIAFLLALILINGFFSLAEMAVVSSRKARLRHEADQGRRGYRLALETAEHPSRFLSTIQIVITLIGTLTGAVGGATVAAGLAEVFKGIPILASIANPFALGIVVVLTTFVSVILGELVPKSLALARPEAIAAAVIRPLRTFALVFSPLVRLLSGTTELIVRALGVSGRSEPAVTEEEVKVLIAQGAEAGDFEDREREMVEGVLSLDNRRVTSLMTPRTEVVSVDLEDGNEAIRRTIIEQAHFAFLPAVEGDLDHVVGLLSVKESLAAIVQGQFEEPRKLLLKPVMVPETTTALKAFSALKGSTVKIALIVDEYGGIAGLVTLADIIEAVVGELPGSASDGEPEIMQREDGSWLVDGSMPIDRFMAELEIAEVPEEGHYETVAGLVLDRMGSIPRAGDRCRWDGCLIEVVDMDGNRIDKVLVSRVEGEEITRAPEPFWD